MEREIQLLRDILAIPSVNGRDDEGRVAEFLCGYFKAAGIPAGVQRIDDRHANVIAVLEGENTDNPVIWNGHLDTVPYGERGEWRTDPAEPVEEDGFLCARGASDMKSGLAAMVCALCRFKESGKIPPRTIRFIGTCDEEKGGLGAAAILDAGLLTAGMPGEDAFCGEAAAPASEILIGEPTGCLMGVAQKGCLWLRMEASGRTSHGAYPEEGCSAIEEGTALAGELAAFVRGYTHPVLGASTAQITQIEGGVAPNMTPDACRILMDIRMVPGLTKDMVMEKAGELARLRGDACGGRFRAEFTAVNARRAIEIHPEHPLTERLRAAVERAGLTAGLTGINYFTDASILAGETPETAVLLFGPGEPGMAHKPNERVELWKYKKAIEILTDMIAADTSDRRQPIEDDD